MKFPTYGPLNQVGLTVPGASLGYGEAEMWSQDQSIMSFTAGMGIVSPQDTAQFFYDLLGPEKKIVSEESAKAMEEWSILDKGWAKNSIAYGGGLMIQNTDFSHNTEQGITSIVGHGGATYGFKSI
jgi:hypothetical protein